MARFCQHAFYNHVSGIWGQAAMISKGCNSESGAGRILGRARDNKVKSIRICILLLTLQLVSRDISFRPHEITFTLKKKNGMFIKTSRPAMRVKGNTKGKKVL